MKLSIFSKHSALRKHLDVLQHQHAASVVDLTNALSGNGKKKQFNRRKFQQSLQVVVGANGNGKVK